MPFTLPRRIKGLRFTSENTKQNIRAVFRECLNSDDVMKIENVISHITTTLIGIADETV